MQEEASATQPVAGSAGETMERSPDRGPNVDASTRPPQDHGHLLTRGFVRSKSSALLLVTVFVVVAATWAIC